jgi:superfamily I DNA/RNA helicase
MLLTDQQRAVIEHDRGPALVLAGAGCAKTTTLCLRARRLTERGVPPNRILVTTFARLGAADTARRCARLGVSPDVRTATLHSLAYQAILESPTERRPVVPHDWMVFEVVQKALRAVAAERGVLRKGRIEGGSVPAVSTVLAEIALAKANLIWPDPWATPPEARSAPFPGYVTWATCRARDPLDADAAAAVARAYAALESAAAAPETAGYEPVEPGFEKRDRWVTFDDMLAMVARGVLRDEGWLALWRGRFDFVLLDETQDNNLAQWTFCEHLAAGSNLMAVGDDQQSIFAFRGARPELMREFLERHPAAAVLPLSVNFRSGQRILDAANGLLARASDRLYGGKLICGRGAGAVGEVSLAVARSPEDEARDVADRIQAEIAARDPNEIAVLYRLNAQKGLLELELVRRGIPYRVSDAAYFRRDEVRAAVGYIACALDPEDVEGWRRCANVPTRYLGHRFLEIAPTLAQARALLARAELGRFRAAATAIRAVDEVRHRLATGGLAAALRYVLEEVPGDSKAEPGLRRFFRERGAGTETTTDTDRACETLLECAGRVALETLGPLEAGAALVRHARQMAYSREERDGERDETPRVTLSTIHKAKGLEWEAVYAVGWNRDLFPLRGASLPEERRLAYVCVTRAKDKLHISFARGEMSEFAEDVDEALVRAVPAP